MKYSGKISGVSHRFFEVFFLTILICFLTAPPAAFPWTSNTAINTPVSLAPEPQSAPAATGDGMGGAIIVWVDDRNHWSTGYDIYAQHMDSTGRALWAANGIPVCTAAGIQSSISIISDGNGGAIAAWRDRRSGSNQIYAQRLSADGTMQWAENGVAVTDTPDGSPELGLVSDGTGGAIFVWEDLRSNDVANIDIYAQRINKYGVIQWYTNELPVASTSFTETHPAIAADGAGGALIIWSDHSDGSDDVYGQRYNSAGAALWTAGGIKIADDANLLEISRAMVSDGGGGALVLYSRYNNASQEYYFYMQRIDASGSTQWTEPTAVTPLSFRYRLLADGMGGAILVWDQYDSDGQGNDMSIMAQAVSTYGNLRWPNDGLLIGHKMESPVPNTLLTDNAGGLVTAWRNSYEISGTGYERIQAQYYDHNGQPQWGADPVAVGTSTSYKFEPVTAAFTDQGAVFTWPEWRNGEQKDLFAQYVLASGDLPGLQTPVNMAPADNSQTDTTPLLQASPFTDDQGILVHAASQWRVNDGNSITPEQPVYDVSFDDASYTFVLPFNFPFFGRTITTISMKVDGLVELLESGESPYPTNGAGTHFTAEYVDHMDAVFIANDDLDLRQGYMRLYNGGTYLIMEWYGATYADDGDVSAHPLHFQLIFDRNGTITWNFREREVSQHDYDLYTGAYDNGGTATEAFASLFAIQIPSAYEFNPETHAITSVAYNWRTPQPVLYDSGEITDLVSHRVPAAAGLHDGRTYFWAVRYMADNNEWTNWSSATRMNVDAFSWTMFLPAMTDR